MKRITTMKVYCSSGIPTNYKPASLPKLRAEHLDLVGVTGFDFDAFALAQEIDSLPREGEPVLLAIDSPGGSISGVDEASRAVHRLAQTRPVVAFVTGQACSAAFWIAAGATTIVAVPSATVGSLGVFTALIDSSEAGEREGYKTIVVQSGELKGIDIDGVAVSDALVASVQRHIDALANLFKAAVKRGRNMTDAQVDALFTGDVWLSEQAEAIGLIDYTLDLHGFKSAFESGEFSVTKTQMTKLENRIKALEAQHSRPRPNPNDTRRPTPKAKTLMVCIDGVDHEVTPTRDWLMDAQKLAKRAGCRVTQAIAEYMHQHPKHHEQWAERVRRENVDSLRPSTS
jgi:signal peptide peptidase SppA